MNWFPLWGRPMVQTLQELFNWLWSLQGLQDPSAIIPLDVFYTEESCQEPFMYLFPNVGRFFKVNMDWVYQSIKGNLLLSLPGHLKSVCFTISPFQPHPTLGLSSDYSGCMVAVYSLFLTPFYGGKCIQYVKDGGFLNVQGHLGIYNIISRSYQIVNLKFILIIEFRFPPALEGSEQMILMTLHGTQAQHS